MDELLNFDILNNSVRSIFIALGVVIFAFLIRKLISQVIANFIIRFFPKRENRTYNTDFKLHVTRPLGDFIFIVIAFTALDRLKAPSFMQEHIFKTTIGNVIDKILIIVVIYFAFRLFTGVAKFLFSIWRNRAEDSNNKSMMQLIGVVGGIVNVILIITAFMLSAKAAFKWDMGAFFTSLGIFSAAIALAGKESLENLIASFIIFLDKPFYIGDYISVGSNQGTIENIGLRSSRLRSSDQTVIVVPNKQMVDSAVTNFTLRTKWRNVETLEVSLAATSVQLQFLQDKIQDILDNYKQVESKYVYLKETGKNAHIIYIEYYVIVGLPMQAVYDIYTDINKMIIDLFHDSKIEFAQSTNSITIEPNQSDIAQKNRQ